MKALLIIDVQNDYFPGGDNEQFGAEVALTRIESVLKTFREKQLPVLHLQHFNNEDSSFFRPDTKGAEIHKSLTPIEGEEHIIKYSPNGFLNTNLEKLLREKSIDELIVCGMMTHMCVDSTVRAASDLGFKVTLIADGTATRGLRYGGVAVSAIMVQTAYLSALGGTFATVINAVDLHL